MISFLLLLLRGRRGEVTFSLVVSLSNKEGIVHNEPGPVGASKIEQHLNKWQPRGLLNVFLSHVCHWSRISTSLTVSCALCRKRPCWGGMCIYIHILS
jgi:hypothetical protein